jgi:acylphosphatase
VINVANDNEQRMELSINGRVQGVGFRHFTVTNADKLEDVTGWVKNEPDGTVSLIAEGPKNQLDQLKSSVREGPRSARVDDIQGHRTKSRDEFSDFKVRYR